MKGTPASSPIDVYRAMLAAAPTHPAKALDVEEIGNKLRELTAWNGTLLYTEAAEWIAALLTTGNASSETEGGK